MSNPKAGPVAYFLLRGEGDRRTQAGPAGSASFLRVSVLYSRANVCTLGVMMLAGLRVPDDDVRELADLVDEPTRGAREGASTRHTIVALSIEDRERILRALDDPPSDFLAELRGVLIAEHEWRGARGARVDAHATA